MWHRNLSNYFNTAAATKKRANCGGFQCRTRSLVRRPQRPSVRSLPGRAEHGGVLSTVETKDLKMYRGKETWENRVRHSIYCNLWIISQKDWKEDPFLLLQSQNFVTKYLEIPSSYFLTIGQAGFEKWRTLRCSFQADWISMLKERCNARSEKLRSPDPSTDATVSSVVSVPPGLAWPPTT